MVVGSGIATSLGFAAESTYGTYVAPSKFVQFNSEDMKKVRAYIQGGGLASGLMAKLGARRVFPTEAAAGTVTMEVTNKGLGVLFAHLMGSSTAPVQQTSTAAYLQTHAFGDNAGKSLTVQEAVADTTGTNRVQTFKGGKILSAEFSCTADAVLTSAFEFDFMRYSEVETLAAPSYAAATPFHFGQMNVKLGNYGSEASVSGVKGVTCKIERPHAVDRYYAGAAIPGTKAEPLMNGDAAVTGTIDIDFVNKADFVDRFHGDTSTSVVLEWVGPIIASTFAQTFRIRLPMVFFTGDTPAVDSEDIIGISVPFEAQLDGTNPLATIEYMTTDITL